MVNRLLVKNIFIKIRKSFGRFLSLFFIVLLGSGFYAGIHAAVPDISAVADKYFKDYRLTDFKIVSTLGLTDEDVEAVRALGDVAAVPSYSLDTLADGKAVRVHALEETVNIVKLIEGRLPANDSECAADRRFYKIGDTVLVSDDAELKNKEFSVVGTVESVLYLSEDYGNAAIGDGKLYSFIFVKKENFTLDAYTEMYILSNEAAETTAYSKQYEQAAHHLYDRLVALKPERENARYEEIYEKAAGEIKKNEEKLNEEIEKGEKALADAKAELDGGKQKLEDGKKELAASEAQLNESISKQNQAFDLAKQNIAAAWAEINSALENYGLTQEEIAAKTAELESAVASMRAQLGLLPAGSAEYAQLEAAIRQASEQLAGLQKLKASIESLSKQEEELYRGIATFNAEMKKAQEQIAQEKENLAESERKLNDGYAEYNKNYEEFRSNIAEARQKIEDAKKELKTIPKPKWMVYGRDAAVGYGGLKTSMNIIESVASVFPVFFILIVALMTSNCMSRMIAEERSELGALTSLGFSDANIILPYIFYVLSATVTGAAAGFYAGGAIIPRLIYDMFWFVLPELIIQYDGAMLSMILAVTVALMIFVTVYSCRKALRQTPAALLRPLPPEKGKKIFLEKVAPVWKRLSFSWKITVRNLFRYTKRGIMTIIGVSGCTALLLTGFGINDSMTSVTEKQFGEIFRYKNIIILKEETASVGAELKSLFEREKIINPLLIRQSTVKFTSDDDLDSYLIVPENKEGFRQYYNLKSRIDGENITLDSGGAVITQKIADALNVSKGGAVTIKTADNQEYALPVADVAENYISNYIFMDKTLYEAVFGGTVSYNAVVSDNNADETALAANLTQNEAVLNVILTRDVVEKTEENMKSFHSLISLVIVVASLLVFVVLYNLTSINISERTREIATLKVLGFTDLETNSYIYREAFILSMASISVGLTAGVFLHRYVITVVEGFVVFLKQIKWQSFVYSAVLTLIFTLLMVIFTYFKLKTVNMLESLKSIE